MVKIKYEHRVLVDRFFMEWLRTTNEITNTDKWQFIRWLMYIKASSVEYPLTHVLMLAEDFNSLVEREVSTPDELKRMVKKSEYLESLGDGGDGAKLIKFAILLTANSPFSTVILTTKEKELEYKQNSHLQSISTVFTKSGVDANDFIKKMFAQFEYARDAER